MQGVVSKGGSLKEEEEEVVEGRSWKCLQRILFSSNGGATPDQWLDLGGVVGGPGNKTPI